MNNIRQLYPPASGERLPYQQMRESELLRADNLGALAAKALSGLAELMDSEHREVRERAARLMLESRELTQMKPPPGSS